MEHFSHRIGSFTRNIGRPPVFVHSRDLVQNGFQFCSVYAVRAEDAEAIQAAGTAAGFKGIVWSQRLWVDFDNHEAADKAEEFLRREGYDFVVYDTGGGRGRHIGVLRRARPSHLLPAQDRAYAALNFPGCDLSLYWHLHLLRLPGAVHERTGRPKRLLSRHEGRELVLPPFTPKDVVLSDSPAPAVGPPRESIFKVWDVMSRLVPDAKEGDRHRHLLILARALKNDAGVTADEAAWVLLEVNRGFDEPKEQEEVLKICRWAYGQGD